MKRKELFIVIICIIAHFCFLCLFGWLWNYDYPKKPDDEISEYIYKKTRHMFKYHGHNVRSNGIVEYVYRGDVTQKKLDKFADALIALSFEECDKIEFVIYTEEPLGAFPAVCSFSNFAKHFADEDEESLQNYHKAVVLHIFDNPNIVDYIEPSLFVNLKDIKYLYIPKVLQEKAEEEGIDWYEIYPELEGVEAF